MDEYRIARENMVARLRDHYRLEDPRVLEVMAAVPRHKFVPEALKFQAYRDNALPIAANQTISQPYIVAKMTELLELTPAAKVLEIGAGSGYQTVILAKLARAVYSIERVPALADTVEQRLKEFSIRNVTLQCGDGTNGWELYSPYDAIIAAAGSPEFPKPLLNQLKVGGRLVIPIGEDPKSQVLYRVIKEESGFRTEKHGACSFVPLIGEHGWKEKS